jgi:hypothetical protein
MRTSTQDDHSRAAWCCPHCAVINGSDVTDHIHNEPRGLVAMEEEHITNGAVCDGWAKHWDAVASSPVVDAVRIVYRSAKTRDHLQRGDAAAAAAGHFEDGGTQQRAGMIVPVTYNRPSIAWVHEQTLEGVHTVPFSCCSRSMSSSSGIIQSSNAQ